MQRAKRKMNEDGRGARETGRRHKAARREGRRWRKNEAEKEDREKEGKEKRAEETHERWIIVKRGKLVVDYSDSNDRVWEFFFFFLFCCPENALIRPFLSYHCNTFNTNRIWNCRRTRKTKMYIWKEDRSSDKHNRALWLTIGHCFDLHDRENLCCWFVLDVVCGHRNNFSRRVIFRGSRLSNGLSLRRLSFFEECRLEIFFLHEDMRVQQSLYHYR